jgi:hypothetical protein
LQKDFLFRLALSDDGSIKSGNAKMTATYASSPMTFHPTDHKYISLGDDQIPYISGTTMKVAELITAHLTYGWSPAELHFQYPLRDRG